MRFAFLGAVMLGMVCAGFGQASQSATEAAAAAQAAQAPSQEAPAAAPAKWEKKDVKDAFSGNEYTEFRLEGKYLNAPSGEAAAPPAMVLRCKAGENGHAQKYKGKLQQAFLYVRTVVDARVATSSSAKVPIRYRLDDGKVHEEFLYPSTTYKALSLQPQFCGFCVVADFLYGHQMTHKENTSPQIKKVVISIPEYMGGDVVVQFDMPDATEVADVCGITYHK